MELRSASGVRMPRIVLSPFTFDSIKFLTLVIISVFTTLQHHHHHGYHLTHNFTLSHIAHTYIQNTHNRYKIKTTHLFLHSSNLSIRHITLNQSKNKFYSINSSDILGRSFIFIYKFIILYCDYWKVMICHVKMYIGSLVMYKCPHVKTILFFDFYILTSYYV